MPEYEPVPEPTHLSKAQPEAGDALIATDEPASYQPLPGETVPPPLGLALIVSWYCVLYVADTDPPPDGTVMEPLLDVERPLVETQT